MTSANTKIRVLVLHGYSQNAVIFSQRLSALRKQAKDIEFVFVPAPHVLLPDDMFGAADGSSVEEMQSNPDTALLGWWRAYKPDQIHKGVTESLLYLRDIMKETPFDGVFGFSQGAGLAALLAAVLERPHLYPEFLIDGAPPHPPFKFCISVAGFVLEDPLCEPFFSPPFETPTLHVIGKTDILVPVDSQRKLIEKSKNARLEEHEGGHFVPSKGPWRKFFMSWIRNPTGDVPSPPAEAASVPPSEQASGANTPALV